MQLLKTINLDNVDKNNIPGWKQREAARAVVIDQDGKIGLLHVRNKHYYKLPGGGIEAGEDIPTALARECAEELGVAVEVIKEIGSIVEYRAQFQLCQTSYCFVANIASDKQAPNFTEDEQINDFAIVWVTPDEAIELLRPKQPTDYEGKFIEERDFCFLNAALAHIKTPNA